MHVKTTPIKHLVLARDGRCWYYRFDCPRCLQANDQEATVSPHEILCAHCSAPLDGTAAKVDLHVPERTDHRV